MELSAITAAVAALVIANQCAAPMKFMKHCKTLMLPIMIGAISSTPLLSIAELVKLQMYNRVTNSADAYFFQNRLLIQLWRMGCVATRWWICKESYDQNLYSG